MSEVKSTRGGAREGAGRPKLENIRKQHQIRAHDDEWELIRKLARIVKHDAKLKAKLEAIVKTA